MKDVFDKEYPTGKRDAQGECETTAPYSDGGAYKTPKEVGEVYPHLVRTYGQQAVDEVFIPKFEEMLQVTSFFLVNDKFQSPIMVSPPT